MAQDEEEGAISDPHEDRPGTGGPPPTEAPADPTPVPYPPAYAAAPPPAFSYGVAPMPYPEAAPPAAAYAAQAMCARHPETAAVGLCPRCGSYMCPWCQRLAADGALHCAACAERLDVGGPVPWDLRRDLGTWRAWWRTFKESLANPNAFFARACHSPFSQAPILYAAMSVWLGQAWVMLLYAVVGIAMAVAAKQVGAGLALAVGSVVGLTLLAPVSAVMQIYVTGGITHLFARLFGGRGDYAASARALGFAVGPYALGVVPYLGGMVGMVASVVLQVFAMKHAHGFSGGKAAAAVLVPLGALLLLCCGGYAALVVAMVAR